MAKRYVEGTVLRSKIHKDHYLLVTSVRMKGLSVMDLISGEKLFQKYEYFDDYKSLFTVGVGELATLLIDKLGRAEGASLLRGVYRGIV